MCVSDFVPKYCYEAIKDDMKQRKVFVHEKEVKTKNGLFRARIDGRYVDKKLARDIWQGHDYLVGIDIDYHGPVVGQGGRGHLFYNFEEVFHSWESFKEWFDKQMKFLQEYGYSDEEFGQMSLF